MNQTISPTLARFFEAEMDNEANGGDSPSTLSSAKDTLYQIALHEIIGCPEDDGDAAEEELRHLIAAHGGETELEDFIDLTQPRGAR